MDITKLHTLFIKSTGISIDTRSLQVGNLYFALSGENFNGNTFAADALEKGAIHAIISDPEFKTTETTVVNNPLKTLQELATYHREYLNLPIIALTGSNGKTTTKELINAVLSKKYRTIATQGNLNNHIGVPLTLLKMTSDTEIGIVEMGANHLKEIQLLCGIAKPNFGYITNFGKAHLEGFGSEEAIIQGKSELYESLKNHNGLAFINSDDPKQIKQAAGISSFTFGKAKNNDLTILKSKANPFAQISLADYNVTSQLIGSYNIPNIAAAITVGIYFKIPVNHIQEAIAVYIPGNNRSQLIKKGKTTIILDAYNANPTSMEAALENLKSLSVKHKILFLGDMFELGTAAKVEHERIAKIAVKLKADMTIFLGENFKRANIPGDGIYYFLNTEDFQHNIPEELKEILNDHLYILIKGSRGMALERLLPTLEQHIRL